MEILVKKNNELFSLGEGRIFSKSQLRLNEDEGMDAHTGYLSNSENVSSGAREAQQLMDKNTTLKNGIEMSGDDATSGKKPGNSQDAQINVNTKDQNSIKQAQTMLNSLSPQNKSNVDIHYYDGSKVTMQTNSVTPRKVLDELRKNSIPFTKKELHNFLKSI